MIFSICFTFEQCRNHIPADPMHISCFFHIFVPIPAKLQNMKHANFFISTYFAHHVLLYDFFLKKKSLLFKFYFKQNSSNSINRCYPYGAARGACESFYQWGCWAARCSPSSQAHSQAAACRCSERASNQLPSAVTSSRTGPV